MVEKKPQRTSGAPVWGIFLLFLGGIFLLQTLNVLPWGLWETLWRFWPVLIIIIGLDILLRRYNVWLVGLLILVILSTCLSIAMWQYASSLAGPIGIAAKRYSEPLGDVEVNYEMNIDEAGLRAGFHLQDSESRLHLSME